MPRMSNKPPKTEQEFDFELLNGYLDSMGSAMKMAKVMASRLQKTVGASAMAAAVVAPIQPSKRA